jgi:hypothetical protein
LSACGFLLSLICSTQAAPEAALSGGQAQEKQAQKTRAMTTSKFANGPLVLNNVLALPQLTRLDTSFQIINMHLHQCFFAFANHSYF